MQENQHKCFLCGAELHSGEVCRNRFDQCLALEYENPGTYGMVHFLTVACFMLQHNSYSRTAWLETRKMVAEYIRQGISPADTAKKNRYLFASGHRKWSITKGAKLAEFDKIIWSKTIADICLDNPERYISDVKNWAKSILEDTDAILANID